MLSCPCHGLASCDSSCCKCWPGQGSPRRAVRVGLVYDNTAGSVCKPNCLVTVTAAAGSLPFRGSRHAAAVDVAGCAPVRLALWTADQSHETASIQNFERWPTSNPSEAAITALLTPALFSPPPWRSRTLAGAFTFDIVHLRSPHNIQHRSLWYHEHSSSGPAAWCKVTMVGSGNYNTWAVHRVMICHLHFGPLLKFCI